MSSYRDKLSSRIDPFTRGAKRSRARGGRTFRRTKGIGDYFTLTGMWQTVRFIQGQYRQMVFDEHRGEVAEDVLPYYTIFQHWDNQRKRSRVCSAGVNEFKPEPCVGCSLELRRNPNYVFTIIHLSDYHKTPLRDRKNPNKIVKRKDGTTVMIDMPCEGRNCPMCASGDEKFFGKRLHLKLGREHLSQLSKRVEDLNAICQCGGAIEHSKFICPKCDQVLIDLDDEETLFTDNDIWNIRDNGYNCDTCGHMVDVLPLPECEKCEDPRPVTLFDVDVSIRKMESAGRGRRTSLDIKFDDPAPLTDNYEGPKDPLPLAEIFAPLPISEQRKEYEYRGEITNTNQTETEEY